jgi:hypothetical protein
MVGRSLSTDEPIDAAHRSIGTRRSNGSIILQSPLSRAVVERTWPIAAQRRKQHAPTDPQVGAFIIPIPIA